MITLITLIIIITIYNNLKILFKRKVDFFFFLNLFFIKNYTIFVINLILLVLFSTIKLLIFFSILFDARLICFFFPIIFLLEILIRIFFYKILIFFFKDVTDNFWYYIEKFSTIKNTFYFVLIQNIYFICKVMIFYSFFFNVFFFQFLSIKIFLILFIIINILDTILFFFNINWYFTRMLLLFIYNNHKYNILYKGQIKFILFIKKKIILNQNDIKFIDTEFGITEYKNNIYINPKKDFFITE